INTWVDVESGGTGGLTADMQAKLNSFVTANRATLVTAGKQAFADVIGGGSVPSDIVEDVVDRFIDDFAREWKAFTDELNEVRHEVEELNAKAFAGGLEASEQRHRNALE